MIKPRGISGSMRSYFDYFVNLIGFIIGFLGGIYSFEKFVEPDSDSDSPGVPSCINATGVLVHSFLIPNVDVVANLGGTITLCKTFPPTLKSSSSVIVHSTLFPCFSQKSITFFCRPLNHFYNLSSVVTIHFCAPNMYSNQNCTRIRLSPYSAINLAYSADHGQDLAIFSRSRCRFQFITTHLHYLVIMIYLKCLLHHV
jgi:hypothetical protein